MKSNTVVYVEYDPTNDSLQVGWCVGDLIEETGVHVIPMRHLRTSKDPTWVKIQGVEIEMELDIEQGN